MHHACALGHAEIVDLLLDAGADPSTTDRENCSAMHRAVFGGNTDIVASLNAFTPRKSNTLLGGNTERSLAANYKHTAIVDILDGKVG